MNQRITLSTYQLVLIALFSASIAVTSQISIPLPFGVPFTLQTLIIPLVGIILGSERGTIAVIVYIFIGIIGLPVFSGFNSGFGALIGPTGGFIISFPILSFAGGITYNKNKINTFIILLIAFILNYIIGLLYFSIITQNNIISSFFYCVAPFLITDFIKIIVLTMFGKKIRDLLLSQGIKL